MRYATPTRSAHRATPAGALALLVRPPGPIGQHRYHPGPRTRPNRHARRDPQHAAHLLTRGLAALIVLGIVVMLGVLIVADERHVPAAPRAGRSEADVDRALASRAVDPAPLSAAEAFPAGSAVYRLAGTDLTADCATAVSGALRPVLQGYGCSQAVRAALHVPYADFRVTAGILNLADAAAAAAFGAQVHELVRSGEGGFTDLAGAETDLGTPIGWRARGHYLMYCVITGPDGELVPADDPRVRRVNAELLDGHLSDTVLTRRAS